MPVEHLTNCHGEWNTMFALLGSLPFTVVWLKLKLAHLNSKD